MGKIIILTLAYNAEKTLHRAVNSIIRQTHDDWIYYLADNGSNDNTRAVISEYAKRDKRIIPVSYDYNRRYPGILDLIKDKVLTNNEGKFVAVLDSDDEYEVNFLEDMYQFAIENDLDHVATGNEFIDASNGQHLNYRKLSPSVILSEYDIACIEDYHDFVLTLWCKFYSIDLLKKMNLDPLYNIYYGLDTAFNYEALKYSNKFGILSGSYYKYYESSKMSSHSYAQERMKDYQILTEYAKQFLMYRYGCIRPTAWNCLRYVYLGNISFMLMTVLKAELSTFEKLENIRGILDYEVARECNEQHFLQETDYYNGDDGVVGFQNSINSIVKWTLKVQGDCQQPEGAKVTAEILTSIHENLAQLMKPDSLEYIILEMPEVIECMLDNNYKEALEQINMHIKKDNATIAPLIEMVGAIYYRAIRNINSAEEAFLFCLDIKRSKFLSSTLLDVDEHIYKLLKANSFLENISMGLAMAIPDTVYLVLKGDFGQAVSKLITASKNIKLADSDIEPCAKLGHNLSTVTQNTEDGIYFGKMRIHHLIGKSR